MPFRILVFSLLLAAAACTRSIVKIGEQVLTKNDIEIAQRISDIYYPEYSGNRGEAALRQLTEAYILAEILKNNGHPVTRNILENEATRIDQSTLMPETLEKLKRTIGSREDYLRLYVLPTYVQRTLYYDFFLHDPGIQAEPLKQAQKLIARLGDRTSHSKTLKELKKADDNWDHIRFTVSLERGMEFEAPKFPGPEGLQPSRMSPAPLELAAKLNEQRNHQISEEGRKWINEIISALKPEQVHPQVLDQQETYWVARYLGPNGSIKGSYKLEAAVIQKANYQHWLEAERKKVVPYFYD